MRFQLGMVGCLLAGCATQPTPTPRDSALALASARGSLPRSAEAPPPPFVLRIGIEHLPPENAEELEPPRAEPAPSPRSPRRAEQPVELRDRPVTERPLLDLASSEDPLAQEALYFVSDLIHADRMRVRREVGLPFFDFHAIDPDRGPLLNSEVALQADHERWVAEHGASLLNRPARNLLRRLPIVRDVEVEIDNFRSENVPLSEPYEVAHDRRRGMGRVSLRLHAGDLDDPVETAWVWQGLRVGSSQRVGKVGVDLPLTDSLQLELRARTEYDTHEQGFRIDLSWRASLSTSMHVAVGDDMDFLSTSSVYSLFESPMDGAPGLVLYAVHIF